MVERLKAAGNVNVKIRSLKGRIKEGGEAVFSTTVELVDWMLGFKRPRDHGVKTKSKVLSPWAQRSRAGRDGYGEKTNLLALGAFGGCMPLRENRKP